jgi:hypothetical protein
MVIFPMNLPPSFPSLYIFTHELTPFFSPSLLRKEGEDSKERSIVGVLKKSFVSLVHALVSFVFNFKSLKHKGSQRASQRNTKVKAAFG